MTLLVRIFLGEDEYIEGEPAFRFVVNFLREEGVNGATVLKAILGYGTTGEYHFEGIESLSYNLPVVIEFVESEDKVMDVLKKLGRYLTKGMVSMERVQLWRYS